MPRQTETSPGRARTTCTHAPWRSRSTEWTGPRAIERSPTMVSHPSLPHVGQCSGLTGPPLLGVAAHEKLYVSLLEPQGGPTAGGTEVHAASTNGTRSSSANSLPATLGEPLPDRVRRSLSTARCSSSPMISSASSDGCLTRTVEPATMSTTRRVTWRL